MTNRPPDPATLIGSRVNSAELEYDYGKALSIELDEYDYFRYELNEILIKVLPLYLDFFFPINWNSMLLNILVTSTHQFQLAESRLQPRFEKDLKMEDILSRIYQKRTIKHQMKKSQTKV